VVELPGGSFGLFRIGESPERGHRPAAVFRRRWLALLAAAVLPGTGRDAASGSRRRKEAPASPSRPATAARWWAIWICSTSA
jgi:hypothetical protein